MRQSLTIRVNRLLAVTAALLCFYIAQAPCANALTCKADPCLIPITLSYHGAKLNVSGESAVNDDLIIKITSPPVNTVMKYKDKVGNIFWMKKGDIDFKGAPQVYLLQSTADITTILPDAERKRQGLGYDAMAAMVKVEDSQGNPLDKKWFDEFVAFKKKDKVYNIQEGTVTRRHSENGNTYSVDIDWPYEAAPGVYRVEALAVRDGKVVEDESADITVEPAGVNTYLSRIAVEQPAFYGIMAIVTAMIAGFIVGAVFKKGGSH